MQLEEVQLEDAQLEDAQLAELHVLEDAPQNPPLYLEQVTAL